MRKPRLESTAKRALQMYNGKPDVAEGFEQEEAAGTKSATIDAIIDRARKAEERRLAKKRTKVGSDLTSVLNASNDLDKSDPQSTLAGNMQTLEIDEAHLGDARHIKVSDMLQSPHDMINGPDFSFKVGKDERGSEISNLPYMSKVSPYFDTKGTQPLTTKNNNQSNQYDMQPLNDIYGGKSLMARRQSTMKKAARKNLGISPTKMLTFKDPTKALVETTADATATSPFKQQRKTAVEDDADTN